MHSPPVSVIIVNWNGARYLRHCLASLSQQTCPALEILIIDNASTDNSLDILRKCQDEEHGLRITVIANQHNAGFCRGNNQGIVHSQGEFVLLLNADVRLAPGFIEHLVICMQEDERIGITLGKLLNGYEPATIDSTGIVICKNRRTFDRGQREVDAGQYNWREEVFGASGAACLYRRKMLEDIKYDALNEEDGVEYLDSLFFAYKEDVDLSWRARLCGWKCVYVPEAVGWHFRTWGAGKRREIPKWVRRHSLKNRYLTLLKNERWDTLRPHFFSLLWFELQSLGYILFCEPHLVATFRDIARLWPEIRRKRKVTQCRIPPRFSASQMRAWFR